MKRYRLCPHGTNLFVDENDCKTCTACNPKQRQLFTQAQAELFTDDAVNALESLGVPPANIRDAEEFLRPDGRPKK